MSVENTIRPPLGARFPALGSVSLGALGMVVFLLVWECVPRFGLVSADDLPPASEVLVTFAKDLGSREFWVAVGATVRGWAIGLGLSAAAATVLGVVIGSSKFLRKFTHSTIEFLRPIPSVALIPLAVLLFGVELQSKLLLVVYASFWQVLIQVMYGVADVDPVAADTARSFGLRRLARIWHVTVPTLLPYLMTGLRLGASVALILAVTAELVIGNPGLGQEIAIAKSGGATTMMYSLVLSAGLLGVVVNLVFRTLERRLLSWHASVRRETLG